MTWFVVRSFFFSSSSSILSVCTIKNAKPWKKIWIISWVTYFTCAVGVGFFFIFIFFFHREEKRLSAIGHAGYSHALHDERSQAKNKERKKNTLTQSIHKCKMKSGACNDKEMQFKASNSILKANYASWILSWITVICLFFHKHSDAKQVEKWWAHNINNQREERHRKCIQQWSFASSSFYVSMG